MSELCDSHRMRCTYLSVLLPGLLLAFDALAESSDRIEWDGGRPLAWADFQGAVPRGADSARVAESNTSIAWSYRFALTLSGSDCQFTVEAIDTVAAFHPERSWVRDGHRNDRVLRHEQGHFDITRIYERRFRHEADQYVGKSRSCRGRSERAARRDIESEISDLIGSRYEALWHEHLEEQQRYDRETRNGINGEAQRAWLERIAATLNQRPRTN